MTTQLKKIICLIAISIIYMGCTNAQDNQNMANINDIFEKMEVQGVDTKKPLLFGYFFFGSDKRKLEKLKDELLKYNYRLVRLELIDEKQFILHVEKIEIHSVQSLYERENKLKKITEKFNGVIYDGWDVGNADPTKPLVPKESVGKFLDTMSKTVLYKMANEMYDNENRENAIILFTKCIEKNIEVDTSNYKLGILYLKLGQIENGIENLKQHLDIAQIILRLVTI